MSWLRVIYRLTLLATATLMAATPLMLTHPIRRFAPRWQTALRNRIFRTWSWAFARTVGMRVEVVGEPPAGAFFLVVNHVSYMDVPLLGGAVDAAFVAKADLRRWPLLGAIFGWADTIFIDRSRKRDVVRVMARMAECRDRGLGVLVFPEGTSGNGDEILRFRPSLLEYPASHDLPVRYAVIRYQTPPGWPPARDTVCWWGNAPFIPHFPRLLRMPGFDAVLEFGPESHHDADRKALATTLRDAMEERFRPCS
jgi:1-acyl-sn-glycerol-3-phosphate acyltransferase